ncbi:MAG: hypothetical protein FD127_3497 [Acidimicrobiaceae bacterium]|nr:MAG: hypothetical protein FD127_3497 [Acidimicrobiaceae bacterium]
MSPSPMRALHHRCTMARPASASAAATTTTASTVIRVRSLLGIASSRIARKANAGTRAMSAETKMATRNHTIVPR